MVLQSFQIDVVAAQAPVSGITGTVVNDVFGNLFVGDAQYGEVLQYNRDSGAFVNAFVPPGPELASATGIVFGPDGNLYVVDAAENTLLRYNGTTGAFEGVVANVSGGDDLTFGPDGAVYVSNYYAGTVALTSAPGQRRRSFRPGAVGFASRRSGIRSRRKPLCLL